MSDTQNNYNVNSGGEVSAIDIKKLAELRKYINRGVLYKPIAEVKPGKKFSQKNFLDRKYQGNVLWHGKLQFSGCYKAKSRHDTKYVNVPTDEIAFIGDSVEDYKICIVVGNVCYVIGEGISITSPQGVEYFGGFYLGSEDLEFTYAGMISVYSKNGINTESLSLYLNNIKLLDFADSICDLKYGNLPDSPVPSKAEKYEVSYTDPTGSSSSWSPTPTPDSPPPSSPVPVSNSTPDPIASPVSSDVSISSSTDSVTTDAIVNGNVVEDVVEEESDLPF